MVLELRSIPISTARRDVLGHRPGVAFVGPTHRDCPAVGILWYWTRLSFWWRMSCSPSLGSLVWTACAGRTPRGFRAQLKLEGRLTNPQRPWDLWGAVRAGLKAAHASWSRSPAPARRVVRRAAALKKPVTFTLREEAIQLARDSGVTPAASAMAKIEGSPIDGSLGSERLCRHVTLTLAEAAQVHDYYRRAADAFTKI